MEPTYGVCSDCHLHNWSAFSSINKSGINDRLGFILDEIYSAAMNVKAEGGKRLYIAGDLFHVRGSVSPTVLNPAIDALTEIHRWQDVEIRVLTGNHDLESRDSEQLSSACETLRMVPGVTVVSRTELFEDDKVAMIPWFDSMDRVRKEIDHVVGQVGSDIGQWTLMLHAPLNSVIAGIPDHGFYAAELAKHGFARVFCGHYHNFKSFPGEVYSVGATTHQTWNDVNTIAGHIVVAKGILTHHFTKAPQFVDFDAGWDDDEAADRCENNYLRVRLGAATEEEIELIRDHVMGLGAKGVVVQAIPTPKTAATARTASVSSSPTVRSSINEWIKSNSSLGADLERLCDDIMNEVEAVSV